MEWIDKKERSPDNHPEFEDCTKTVIVTDGMNWGYGHYDYQMKRWVYYLVGVIEQGDNKITHWAEPPVLPKLNDNLALPLQSITVSLPSDKVIEDWYTKDFDSLNARFWEEAPFCTHGDRVEEIKNAIHYFITGKER